MKSRTLSRCLVPLLVGVTVVRCDGAPLPQAADASPRGKPTPIHGEERLVWNQEAPSAREVERYLYAVHVDGVRSELSDVRCESTSRPSDYECSAPLPRLTAGPHVIRLSTIRARRGSVTESPRSPPLNVVLIATMGAASPGTASISPSGAEAAAPGESTASNDAEGSTAITLPGGTRLLAETVAANLNDPTAVAVGPDGKLFIAERAGRVLAYEHAQLRDQTLLEGVAVTGDAGVLGLALHPDFARNGLVYVVDTAVSVDRTLSYRLSRFRQVNGVLGERTILLDDIPATAADAAAVVRFGPDGKLYVALGLAGREASGSPASYNGSLLRLNDDGSAPDDNPWPSPVFSIGHHSPRGFDWDPATGYLWEVESIGNARGELNRIQPGSNYGDDQATAGSARQRPGTVAPVVAWQAALRPSGAAMYDRTLIESLRSDLLIATLEGEDIVRVRFDPRDRARTATTERLLLGRFGRIGGIEVGPDGAIYFMTANRGHDGASARDDRLIRLVPAASQTLDATGTAR